MYSKVFSDRVRSKENSFGDARPCLDSATLFYPFPVQLCPALVLRNGLLKVKGRPQGQVCIRASAAPASVEFFCKEPGAAGADAVQATKD